MEKEGKVNLVSVVFLALIGIFFMALVLATAPQWNISNGINQSFEEDQSPAFTYNVSANITDPEGDNMTFSLTSTITSGIHGSQSTSFFYWITLNETTGILTINSTQDNETGVYNLTIEVSDDSEPPEVSETRFFSFTANATNDFPTFTTIRTNYTLIQNTEFYKTLVGIDEEEHYPLVFNVTFVSCEPADWSTRGSNCTLFLPTNLSNTTTEMNYTPVYNDVGIYTANISVMDAGNTSSCPFTYCETNYSRNLTTYSALINFTVQGILEINISNCQNQVFTENVSNTCQVNITTKGQTDNLNISTLATIRNYDGTVVNSSWFFANNTTAAIDFLKTVDINFTPQKTEIGNWTINFTVLDTTTGETNTTQIFILVNRTNNDPPELLNIPDVTTSTNLSTTINITVHDEDLRIPDKLEGYNETINITRQILNQTNLSQTLTLTGFDINITFSPVSGTNRTEAHIQFTPNATEFGNYTINITVKDRENSTVNQLFNLTIILNTPPTWNASVSTVFNLTEDTAPYFNFTQNVSDPEGDSLNFTFTNDSRFDAFVNSFNLTTGVLNFSISNLTDFDVGYHNVTITVFDGFLSETKEFNFTVTNVHDNPTIASYTVVGDGNRNVNTNETFLQEDNVTELRIGVSDGDLNIPDSQSGFYDENHTINTTIEGPNTTLFAFTYNAGADLYTTSTFNASKSDVGEYNITINVTDANNNSVWIQFNLTVIETQHAPVMTSIGNLNFSIFENMTLDINTTDTEDVNETAPGSNLTYTITNLTAGGAFLNSSNFNSSTGVLTFNFSQTYAGHWTYNISVNDSTNKYASEVFNITVFDYPKITLPLSSFQYNMVENQSFGLNFSVNHTVGIILNDTLTYTLTINNITRNTTAGYGNGTEFIWFFAPNFTDETGCFGSDINLTLNVSNEKLSNTTSWNLTINHTNYPLSFDTTIDEITNGTTHIVLLSGHFTDIDATDSCTNQTIDFSHTLINETSGSMISVAIQDWTNTTSPTLTFSISTEGTHVSEYNITAEEKNSSNLSQTISTVYSNDFNVTMIVSTTVVTVETSGGGSSDPEPEIISLRLLVPEPVSSKKKDILIIPLGVVNDGDVTLKNIVLSSLVAKGGLIRSDLVASFDRSFIDLLVPGQRVNVTMIVDVDTTQTGIFEVTINGTVEDPEFSDFTKFFIDIREDEDIIERIIFTEEFIVGNPQCAEFKDLVDEARTLADQEDLDGAEVLLNQAIDACTKAISQPFASRIVSRITDTLFNYVGLLSLIAFGIGFTYYFYQRIRLRGALKGY